MLPVNLLLTEYTYATESARNFSIAFDFLVAKTTCKRKIR